MIEASTTVGGIDLAVGQLVVSLLQDDYSVGNFPEIATTSQDVLVMDVSTTGLGTTAATLTLLLDGDNIGLDSNDEAINGLAFVPSSPVNEQVITTNAGHTVAEGSVGTIITNVMLETTDVDDTSAELVYTVTAVPVNGHVNISGTALSMNDTFTQSDINNNRITYDHDGTDTADDSVGFSVDDGAGSVSTSIFAITVTPVNDEEQLVTNTGHTVTEGRVGAVITSAMLETTDVDNTATELVYTVTAVPVNGHVNLGGIALGVNDMFTQSDINNNRITYDHDGTDTANDIIGFSVDDGAGSVSTGIFAITVTPVDDEELLVTNTGHTVAEGSLGAIITSAMLETVDVDNTAMELVYTVTAVPVNGYVNISGTALSMNDTFTQSDIDNNRITYDHDGTDTADDSIGFSVDDGAGTASTGTFTITVTPVDDEEFLVTNTGHTVVEGSVGTVIEVYLVPSIGIAGYPEDALEPATLTRFAMGASSQAVTQGGGRLQFYSASMNERSLIRIRMEANLRRALEKSEFLLLYQPKVSVSSGEVIGAEALIRWFDSDVGVVSPAEFIPVAEDTGMILPIGEWVLREACRQYSVWREQGIDMKMSINISARQFFEADLVALVGSLILEYGIDPSRLVLEMTESILVDKVDTALALLEQLRELGVQISIDDFGTGYSSLSYLKMFRANEVKIDRAFIKDIVTSREDQALVYAITYLSHEMGFTVCAEGVEDKEQEDYLRTVNCDEYQGFFFSRPVSASDFAALYISRQAA